MCHIAQAAFDVTTVSDEAVRELMNHYGYLVSSISRLKGGFSSSNLHCRCPVDQYLDQSLLLKLANADHSLEDIALQCRLLTLLEKKRFPTNYLHCLLEERWNTSREGAGGEYIDTSGPQYAILLDFCKGIPGDKLLQANAANPEAVATILRSLGSTLGRSPRSDPRAH